MDADYILVGGGLQNGLIALALEAVRPDATVVMVERGPAPGGNHTWCFHAGDLASITAGVPSWIDRLIVARWDGYDVAFPAHTRTLESPYACVSSERFAEEVTASLRRPRGRLVTRASAIEVGTHHVLVRHADGSQERLSAHSVIDARGPEGARDAGAARSGWQKFLGQELQLAGPHGLVRPMLMDATVRQLDGFRFLYVLPLSANRVLVEDTYFSDGTRIDVTELRERVAAYVAERGWRTAALLREEVGLLPLPLQHPPPVASAPLVAGYAGGWFHPVTGYSFPIAARLASMIASLDPDQLAGAALAAHAAEHGEQMRFALRLNRMLFGWFPPEQRFRVLERFYRLPEAVIRRFYALELTALDRMRILVGRPPKGLSLMSALGLRSRGADAP